MKYRKKPVVIEAEQFTEESKNSLLFWAAERNRGVYPSVDESGEPVLQIPTLEGEMTASLGDYIICGVSGELYPCKPDIFGRTYEAVNAEPKARTNFDRMAAENTALRERLTRVTDERDEAGPMNSNRFERITETLSAALDYLVKVMIVICMATICCFGIFVMHVTTGIPPFILLLISFGACLVAAIIRQCIKKES